MKRNKQAIIVISVCLCCTLAISIFLFAHDITSIGGAAMKDDGGTIQSTNAYGALFISFVLMLLLFATIKDSKK